jgi:nucleoside-diphosphate-sugar epimerase
VLVDRVPAPSAQPSQPGSPLDGPAVLSVAGDLAAVTPTVFNRPVDVLFHLASAVSAECEADFDLGLRANLEATLTLLQAARRQYAEGGPQVRLVFSSSLAVYGVDPCLAWPERVSESTLPVPQTSYGSQKLICEQLIADFTRKGFIDGRVARLMTVVIRPGRPNAAASGFVSGIIREPLAGVVTRCPVGTDLEVAIASPRRTVDGIITIAECDRGDGPGNLSGGLPVNLPALTVSVAEMLAALRTIAGDAVADLVSTAPDPAIERIVRSWPARFDNARATALGLSPDPDIASVIEQYRADHLD